MTALSLFVLLPIRFEYMVSVLGLGYTGALARVAMGEAASLAGHLASLHVRRQLCPAPPCSASSRIKLKAA